MSSNDHVFIAIKFHEWGVYLGFSSYACKESNPKLKRFNEILQHIMPCCLVRKDVPSSLVGKDAREFHLHNPQDAFFIPNIIYYVTKHWTDLKYSAANKDAVRVLRMYLWKVFRLAEIEFPSGCWHNTGEQVSIIATVECCSSPFGIALASALRSFQDDYYYLNLLNEGYCWRNGMTYYNASLSNNRLWCITGKVFTHVWVTWNALVFSRFTMDQSSNRQYISNESVSIGFASVAVAMQSFLSRLIGCESAVKDVRMSLFADISDIYIHFLDGIAVFSRCF